MNMMKRRYSTISWLTAALLATAACGGDERSPTPGGGGTDAMPGADATPSPMGDAFVPVDGAADPLGPQVELLSPTAPEPGDYARAAILTNARFTVTCAVTANPDTGSPVDSSSVQILAIGEDGSTREVAAQPTGEPGRYAARLNLADFANGRLVLRCEAADLASEPRRSSDEITTYFDQGPRITVFVPMVEASYANQLEIIFAVAPTPVAADDTTGAAVNTGSVQAQLAGRNIPGLAASGDVFQASIRFDSELFDPPLVGEQTLRISAPNARGVVRVHEVVFRVDSDGPTIVINEPTAGDLVAGIMTVEAQIIDPVGIEPTSVVATIAGADQDHQFALTQANTGNIYRGTFDTRILTNMVYPTIVVRAQDTTGNQSAIGFVVSLDNTPPRVTMEPFRIREARRNPAGVLECSLLFDPLEGSARDGQTLPQLSLLRARAEDRSNTASAVPGVVFPLAGVAQNKVTLFVLDDTTRALVVDRDNNGYCDDVNPLLVPTSIPSTSNEIARIEMVPLAPAGQSKFGPAAEPFSGPDGFCTAALQPTSPPPLCDSTTNTRIIAADNANSVPAIYAIPPIGDLRCLGNAFDSVATGIQDGWACVVVRAEDTLGNVGLSRPLRVCLDHDSSGEPECTQTPMPDCRGIYNQATDTVDSAATCYYPGESVPNGPTLPPLFYEREVRLVR